MFPAGMNSYLLPSRDVRPPDAVVIYQSELDYLSRCILDYPNIETGGQLFGYWTSTGVPVVLYVLGPGENANHRYAFFNQDLECLETVGGWLTRDFGLQHIGEWHSHHQLGLAHPSSHDERTIRKGMLQNDLPRLLLCIGNCTDTTATINAFNFIDNSPMYQEAQWETTRNGVNGILFTANNGYSLFLPAAGWRQDDVFCNVGIEGLYWLNSITPGTPFGAWYLGFGSDGFGMGSTRNLRYYGRSVRAVRSARQN